MVVFHWYDLIPVVEFIVLVLALVVLAWGIGVGYAWMRRRQGQQSERP